MAQTRAQGAAKRQRNLDEQDHAPTPQCQRRKTQSPLPGKGRRRGIEADDEEPDHPVVFWTREGHWPREWFEPDLEHLLALKRSLYALDCKRSSSALSTTPSDQKPREEKSAQYRDERYETLLATKGSFMVRSKLDIASQSKTLCRTLLEKEQTHPENSLFRDDLFDLTCQKVHNRNEARVIQDIPQ